MIIGKELNKDLLKEFDFSYFIKFVGLVIILYFLDEFIMTRLDVGKSTYSPFIHDYMNYPSWLVTSILHTSNLIAHSFGLNSYLDPPIKLRVVGGSSIFMLPACLGMKIMSFWVAFTIADRIDWKKKLLWCCAGVLAIWAINCFRVALVLLAVQNKWQVNKYMDHHRLFNIAAYALIILMVYVYYRINKENEQA